MPVVVVVGGGFGGATAARALDDVADVILVEARDAFVHNVAALRALTDPEWADRIFLPYARLLDRGQVVRDRVVRADAAGVTLASGSRIAADYIILASGSDFPFPGKMAEIQADAAKAKILASHSELARAESVLLLGAGPVGLEFAGEIKAAWPGKAVVIADPATDILSGEFVPELRAQLRHQLAALGVELVLGSFLRENPPTESGLAKTFTVTTRAGREITADIWFRCFGMTPAAGFLAADLSGARRANGYVEVTAQLRLPGQERVFAVGDITALPEAKMASAATRQARVAAQNIRSLIGGTAELADYVPAPAAISIPLGPAGGASYLPGTGVLDAEATARLKGADLRVGHYAELFRCGEHDPVVRL